MDNINMMLILFTIILLLLSAVIWFYKRAFNYWKERGIDYLEPSIPFGNTLNLYVGKRTIGEIFSDFYLQLKQKKAKHGGAYFLWKPVYIPVDAELIKRILITDFEQFPNHGLYISEKDDPMSGHIFNMESEKWKMLRTRMPSAFTSAKMRKMFMIMENKTKVLNDNLYYYAENNTPLNTKKELSRLTIDTLTACILGINTNTMGNENKELLVEARTFFDYQWSLYKNSMVILVPRNILQKFKFRIIKKSTEVFFMDLFNQIVKSRKQEQAKRGDLTDTLMQCMKSEKEKEISDKYIKESINFEEFSAQMFIFLAAGFETSSSTVSFALYELAKNIECQNKLRQEINSISEKYGNKITYDSVMEMKYLDKVVNETLRLYPVFPILPRVCVNDYKVPGTDFTIDKNTFVLVSNMGIQRDPEYWPEPEKFDPERFSEENKAKRPFIAHVPFGEGQRICVGKRFGLLQSKLGIITAIRNYEVTLNEKTTPSFKFASTELILRKTGDIWLNVKKINV